MGGKILFFVGILAAILLAVFLILNICWIIKKRKERFDRTQKKYGIIRHLILFLVLAAIAFFLFKLLPQVFDEMATNKAEIVDAKNGMNLSANTADDLERYKKFLKMYKNQLMLDYAAVGTFALTAINCILNAVLAVIYMFAKRPKIEDDEE